MTRLAKATAAVVATLLGLAALWEFRDPVLIFLLSLVVAAAARAPTEYLAGHGLPKSAALAAVYVAGLLVVAGLVVAAIYLVSGELGRATDDFKELYEYAASHSSAVVWIERTAGERLPRVDELLTALAGRHGEQAVRLALGTAFGVVSAAVDVVFVIALSIYWAIDRAYFERLWLSLLPLPQRVSARELWQMLESELGAYVRSELAQSLLAGIVLWAGFYLLGLNYPALLAVVAALSWLLPWLGAIIALAALVAAELPALVLNWPGSLFSVAMAAFFTVLVFVVLESCVEPRMFNRRRYNSLFIVLAVIALTETFGIPGLLLGPMAAVAIQATLEHVERKRITARHPATDLVVLEGRLADLRAGMAPGEDVPREWISMVDRLEALIAKARAICDHSG
jgi:predicted PurR-regulated permease PerM